MEIVKIAHGGGGKAMEDIITEVFLKNFGNNILNALEDAAVLNIEDVIKSGYKVPEDYHISKDTVECKIPAFAFTTDSFIVKPIVFPGGDIGRLSVCGTVNDLLCRGAVPLYIGASFIIEEGFEIQKLKNLAISMGAACREAGVWVVAGDTKVAERGAVDEIFINTSGIGIISPGIDISVKNARPGDLVLISGTIGDHGMAVLAARENLEFEAPPKSDTAPLVEMVRKLLSLKKAVKVLRDPTRGGVAEVLNEIAARSGVGIEIWEDKLPAKPEVLSACGMLGLDFLHLANEGKLIAVIDKDTAEQALQMMQGSLYGENAQIIGKVTDSGCVTLKTHLGTFRMIDRPLGELLPRIC